MAACERACGVIQIGENARRRILNIQHVAHTDVLRQDNTEYGFPYRLTRQETPSSPTVCQGSENNLQPSKFCPRSICSNRVCFRVLINIGRIELYLTDCPKMRSPFYFHYLSSREMVARQMVILYYYSVCPINDRSVLFIRRRSSYFVHSHVWHVTDLRYSLLWKCEWLAPFIFQSFFHVVLTNEYSFTTIRLKMIILFYVSDERLMYNICINKIWFTCCCLFHLVSYFSSTCLTNDSPIPLVLNRLFYFIKSDKWLTYLLVSPQNILSYVYILFKIVNILLIIV